MKSREDLANGERKIEAFLTHLAVDEQVASATQNQAMNALVFLYRRVFQLPLNETINAVRADRKVNVPVVLTREEVVKVISLLEGAQQLIVKLLYGSGLRIMEAVRSPTLHTTWAPRHVQPEVLSGGQRNTQKIFGAVAVLTGQSLFRRREAQFNHDTYVEFLEDMTKFFFRRGHRIYRIQDNASYHKHPITYEWFSKNRKYTEVFHLPPYSPDFNVQEKRWKYTRKQATHNRYHETETDLCAALTHPFDTMQNSPELIIPFVAQFR